MLGISQPTRPLAVVTGGSSGIGYELAREFARNGFDLLIAAENDQPRSRTGSGTPEILIMASPTWLGRPSSVAQRVLERMDAVISETDGEGRPVAYRRVAGVVVTGNEDGAHHAISEIFGALGDTGYTIPGQAWTYWHLGQGLGPDYLDTDQGHDWSASTGRAMAANLAGVAAAVRATAVTT